MCAKSLLCLCVDDEEDYSKAGDTIGVLGGQKGWFVAAASFACTALFQDHYANKIIMAELFQCIAWLWKIAPVPICLSVLSGSPDAKSLAALIVSLAMLKSLGAQLSWCWNVPGPFHCNDGCTDMWWGFELSRLARASHHQSAALLLSPSAVLPWLLSFFLSKLALVPFHTDSRAYRKKIVG